jgi:carnosine N-methyltransferase
LQAISIPDVLPSDLPEGSNFSLVAGQSIFDNPHNLADNRTIGDFEEVYGSESHPGEPQAGEWDAIMTCFFIDTVRNSSNVSGTINEPMSQAKNIVNYLRIIHRILAPGGVWINLGLLQFTLTLPSLILVHRTATMALGEQ